MSPASGSFASGSSFEGSLRLGIARCGSLLEDETVFSNCLGLLNLAVRNQSEAYGRQSRLKCSCKQGEHGSLPSEPGAGKHDELCITQSHASPAP